VSDLLRPPLIAQQTFNWGSRTYLMGVINVTPDSFSDGGQFNSVAAACQQAAQFVQAGADILDIGGESTRPGATSVNSEQELEPARIRNSNIDRYHQGHSSKGRDRSWCQYS
jgi:dihydropteroate synthase